jgi:alpha-ribazole phosphatase
MDLILIRHPPVAVEGVCYGHWDAPLAGDASAEADALLARLRGLHAAPPSRVVTSPSTRCAAVAARLAEHMDKPLATDPRLRELDFGAWERQRWDAVDRSALDAWAADVEHARPHGGESMTMVAARVGAWFDDTCAAGRTVGGAPDHAPVLWVVAHAGPIRLLTARVLNLPATACLNWTLATSGIVWLGETSIDPSARWTLRCWNR